MRKLSDKGLRSLAGEEGFVDHVYWDKATKEEPKKGVPTVAIGHAVLPGETFPEHITYQEGLALFHKDLARFEAAVNSLDVELTQNQFDALVSFAFNIGIGPGRFFQSAVVFYVRLGAMESAADNFWQWRKSGGELDPRLVARREREKTMFLTPDEAVA